MAMLFDREESNIRRHVINVFKEGELKKENNVHFLHVNGVLVGERARKKSKGEKGTGGERRNGINLSNF